MPTPNDWLILAAGAFCIGVGKAGFGGVGMLALIAFALVLPARESTGAILPLLIAADVLAIIAFARHVVWRQVFLLLPPALAGVVVGFFVMPRVSDGLFAPLIGWMILALLAMTLAMKVSPALRNLTLEHPQTANLLGFLAGVTTMLANAAGPIVTLYLLACRLPKMLLVGTAAWYFFILNTLKVPFSAGLGLITRDSLNMNLFLAPAVIVGFFVGRWVLGRISQSVFEVLLLVFALVGAIRLIVG